MTLDYTAATLINHWWNINRQRWDWVLTTADIEDPTLENVLLIHSPHNCGLTTPEYIIHNDKQYKVTATVICDYHIHGTHIVKHGRMGLNTETGIPIE